MRYVTLLLALVALLTLGCFEATGPDGLKVELRTDRTTFAPGDTFDGTFTVSNTRPSQVHTQFGALPRYEMEVYDEQDSVVLRSPWAYLMIMNELVLGPWDSESYRLGFVVQDISGTEPVPVGDYRIRVHLSGHNEPHDDLMIRVE
jgi:hypothetical protein